MTQSEPAALDDWTPSLPATAADELLPDPTVTELPPGETLVLPLNPCGPAVIEVEFVLEFVSALLPWPLPSVVTTRQGFPLTVTVPFGPEVTATLAPRAGPAASNAANRAGRAALLMFMQCAPEMASESATALRKGADRQL